VFMDAHDTVTVEEGDRYPLAAPILFVKHPTMMTPAAFIHVDPVKDIGSIPVRMVTGYQ